MPRRKRKSEEPDAPAPMPVPSDAVLDGEEELGTAEVPPDVEAVLDEIGGQVSRICLYRKPERGTQYEFIGEMDADAFTLRAVQEQYGGGQYLARFAGANRRWIKAKSFSVAAPKVAKVDVGGGGELAGLVREMLAEMRASRAPASDPAAMMAAVGQLGQAVATQVTALLPLIAGKGEGNSEKSLDLFIRALEFAEERGGGEGAGYGSVIREIGKPLLEMLGRHQQGAPAALPAGEGAAVAVPSWVQVLRRYVPQLAQLAARGDDPGLWAAALDAQQPRLARWLEGRVGEVGVEPFAQQVLDQFPALAAHREWLTAFLAEFGPEPEDDETPGDRTERENGGGSSAD